MVLSSPAPRAALALGLGLAVVLAACGGDPPGHKINGPFVQLAGAHARSFAITPGPLQVVCKPKPGLKEFEFEAATVLGSSTGTFFRFTIKEYTGPRDYDLEYDVGKPAHLIEVGVPAEPPSGDGKGYRYKFFQHLRSDLNVTYHSHCDLSIAAVEQSTKTRFSGTMACSMLFADFSSKDNNSSGALNAFVDLDAKFECDY